MVFIMRTATKQQQEALFTCSDLTFVIKYIPVVLPKHQNMNYENVN